MTLSEKRKSIYDLLEDREKKTQQAKSSGRTGKRQPKKTALKKDEKEHNGATRDLWISTFYKMIRIGNPQAAFTAYTVLSEVFNVSDQYVLTKLEGLVGEDSCPSEMPRLLPMLRVMEEKRKDKSLWGHHIAHAIQLVARSKKWYQTEMGRELEQIRHSFYNRKKGERDMDLMSVPSISKDGHTRAGHGKDADKRLDGHWWNRWNVEKRWRKLLDVLGFEEPLTDEEYEIARDQWVKWHMKSPTELKRDKDELDDYSFKTDEDFKEYVEETDEEGIFKVRSETSKNKKYDVNMNEGTCTCPAFEKSKGKRPCKHIRWTHAVLKESEQ